MSLANLRRFRALWLLAMALIVASTPVMAASPAPASAKQEYGPDPASVRRYGPAYRYPQNGWVVLHIEGEPYDRGYQHGRLMAPEIADFVKTLALKRSPQSPGTAWRAARTLVNALFLRRYDKEYLEEMKGTADGAAAAGATFEGRPLDLLDVVAINSEIEADFLESALEATAEGLESKTFREPAVARPKAPRADHCSAFAAVGPATPDGSIVIGHITMWGLPMVRYFNVWLDVKPAKGHRVLMQTYPGGIQSGMDYYMNDAGMVVTETTIAQTKFDPEGIPLASRIRQALQYGDSIDAIVAALKNGNNGLYTNEWLIADIKSNEIAMFELGTAKTKLWRSSKNEWFGGTTGFYWGCNNAKDLAVRMETVPAIEGKPANMVFRASDRDRAWLSLFDKFNGKIDADFGTLAFTTPPLAAHPSCDAKFTTSAMARELKNRALFGPPMGRAWEPTEADKQTPGVRPLIGNDWTTLTVDAPAGSPDDRPAAVDLAGFGITAHEPGVEAEHPPAWHGTLLPKTDADAWLAAAFADFETIVSMEKAEGAEAAKDRVGLALYGAKTRYLTATRRLGRDVPLSRIKADRARSEWYEIAAGKGVLLLAALREKVGAASFAAMMDSFGRANAGREVEASAFRAHAEKAAPDKQLGPFFDRWLGEPGLPGRSVGGTWAVDSFHEDLDQAMIVYGTIKDVAANREAAVRLQTGIANRWSNILLPVKADTEVTEPDWKSHHVLLVGRPETNLATARCSNGLPARFGATSFTIKGETYGHEGSALIVAGENPTTSRFGVVVYAGLGADATWHAVEHLGGRRGNTHPEGGRDGGGLDASRAGRDRAGQGLVGRGRPLILAGLSSAGGDLRLGKIPATLASFSVILSISA